MRDLKQGGESDRLLGHPGLSLCLTNLLTQSCALFSCPPSADLAGAGNGIENGLVKFDRNGDGAGKRSGCKAWNSIGGISNALNRQGAQTSPPENTVNRNCQGVITDYNGGK